MLLHLVHNIIHYYEMISATIIKDSISPTNKRITTFELEYPRFIHSELMTHRVFSRNAASSRAIPIEAMIKQVLDDPAMPVWWGKNQSGMQAKEEISDEQTEDRCWATVHHEPNEHWEMADAWMAHTGDLTFCKKIWLAARDSSVSYARQLASTGLHKQIVNRILEPWAHIKVVVTSTEWDNWYSLRNHPDAQPEIHKLANDMMLLHNESVPQNLSYGTWHLPYINGDEGYSTQDAIKVSASLCAQVSYRKSDDSLHKAMKIFDRLIESKPPHASPMEHQATPMYSRESSSGNFKGWLQYRQTIKDNACSHYPEFHSHDAPASVERHAFDATKARI